MNGDFEKDSCATGTQYMLHRGFRGMPSVSLAKKSTHGKLFAKMKNSIVIIILILMISCNRGSLIQLDLHDFKKFAPDTIYWPVVNEPKAFCDIEILEYYPYNFRKNKNINWANIYICYVKDTKDTIILIDCKHAISEYVYKKFDWFIIDLKDKNICPTAIYVDLPKKNKVNSRFKYFCGTPKAVLD